MQNPQVREVRCRSVLHNMEYGTTREFTANFYKGCLHGCVYCYVPSLIRDEREWGSFVDVKINAPEVLEAELRRARRGVVFLSSATDPYQALEARYRITRRCLDSLRRHTFPTIILTRSPLVLRDVDILRRFEWLRVGVSISSVPEARYEPRVPPLARRIEALARLSGLGIKTWVSMAPLIPKLMKIDLRDVLGRLREAGVSAVSPGLLRFQGYPESKAFFEKSLGISSEGLGEDGAAVIAEARETIDRLGFEPLSSFFEWHPRGGLEEYGAQ